MLKSFRIILVFLLALQTADAASLQAEWPDTNFSRHSIPLEDVLSSGRPKDGAPAIVDPHFKYAIELQDIIPPSEPVISLEINGEARAYPLRVLIWHQIVNDTLGGTPILVTYCPLCNTSIVFDRRIDGKEKTFGVTGKLYKSNMLMYDWTSKSWWQQFTGSAVVGAQTDAKLSVIASRVESFELFRLHYPVGKVLVPNDPYARNYGLSPYEGYDSGYPFLYKGKYHGSLSAMDYLVVVGNEAWPLALLREKKRIETDALVLQWLPGQNSALDNAEIFRGADEGNIIVVKKTSSGIIEDAPYLLTFAFAFEAFHPDGIIHKE